MANTIEYEQGRQAAFIELKSLLSIAHPTQRDIDILIAHCNNAIEMAEKYINISLILQEV